MEEDLKVLEEMLDIDKHLGKFLSDNRRQAIENLIKGYKELEECLKAEEKYAEGLNNDIKSLLNIEPNNNFIPKSKVREKIEELEKLIQKLDIDEVKNEFLSLENYICKKNKLTGGIYYLQELLQEGDK